MCELEDVQDHIAKLIINLQSDPDYDEGNLRIELGHIYTHLNRAWYRRNVEEDFQEGEFEVASELPDDLAMV